MGKYVSPIKGHLDVLIGFKEDEYDGEVEKWQEVIINGDPDGLRSFATLLLKLADLDQNAITELPIGAKEHLHLQPDIDISISSVELVVGRLDAKGTGEFYQGYIPKTS